MRVKKVKTETQHSRKKKGALGNLLSVVLAVCQQLAEILHINVPLNCFKPWERWFCCLYLPISCDLNKILTSNTIFVPVLYTPDFWSVTPAL